MSRPRLDEKCVWSRTGKILPDLDRHQKGTRGTGRTGPGKKSKSIVTNSAHNANNSMTKGMLDEDKVIETCDHDSIECLKTCSEWEWFTSKVWG
jgi:hypothetical protein